MQMKKLILKTALITFGITIILMVSLFGILSFCAPSAMMKLFDSLGLENISGDYAYQEYQHTKVLDYLARSFEIAASNKKDDVAESRFEELYGEDGSERRSEFGEYCVSQNGKALPDKVPAYDYRAYVCGLAACVRYRSAVTDTEKEAVYAFAVSETPSDLPAESPVIALIVEAAENNDRAYCSYLSQSLDGEGKFDKESENYLNIKNLLSEYKENASDE